MNCSRGSTTFSPRRAERVAHSSDDPSARYRNCDSSSAEFVGSVVGEDACVCHHTGADALPVADPQLRGGAPARTDRIM
jgi:hypothetical protein